MLGDKAERKMCNQDFDGDKLDCLDQPDKSCP
jgi:hypothetical protein